MSNPPFAPQAASNVPQEHSAIPAQDTQNSSLRPISEAPPQSMNAIANNPRTVQDVAPQAVAMEAIRPSASGHKHHNVNSTVFRIAYDLDDVGPSGVSRVDLYISEDGGRKWFHYGADPDRLSPIEVTVPRDGEFGFAFRVTNGLGRASPPPQPNDAPEVTVNVDRVPPIAKLLPIQAGQDLSQNQVTISWTAQDRDLAERPIMLFFSTAPTGPWAPLQGWQPNSGRFTWAVPPGMNQPFYVRLDVQDLAGNVTRIYSEQPYLVDRAQPRARVTEVESLSGTPR
jgi:hypothetical protein